MLINYLSSAQADDSKYEKQLKSMLRKGKDKSADDDSAFMQREMSKENSKNKVHINQNKIKHKHTYRHKHKHRRHSSLKDPVAAAALIKDICDLRFDRSSPMGCEDCILGHSHCGYCAATRKCVPGSQHGPTTAFCSNNPTRGDWRWFSCNGIKAPPTVAPTGYKPKDREDR